MLSMNSSKMFRKRNSQNKNKQVKLDYGLDVYPDVESLLSHANPKKQIEALQIIINQITSTSNAYALPLGNIISLIVSNILTADSPDVRKLGYITIGFLYRHCIPSSSNSREFGTFMRKTLEFVSVKASILREINEPDVFAVLEASVNTLKYVDIQDLTLFVISKEFHSALLTLSTTNKEYYCQLKLQFSEYFVEALLFIESCIELEGYIDGQDDLVTFGEVFRQREDYHDFLISFYQESIKELLLCGTKSDFSVTNISPSEILHIDSAVLARFLSIQYSVKEMDIDSLYALIFSHSNHEGTIKTKRNTFLSVSTLIIKIVNGISGSIQLLLSLWKSNGFHESLAELLYHLFAILCDGFSFDEYEFLMVQSNKSLLTGSVFGNSSQDDVSMSWNHETISSLEALITDYSQFLLYTLQSCSNEVYSVRIKYLYILLNYKVLPFSTMMHILQNLFSITIPRFDRLIQDAHFNVKVQIILLFLCLAKDMDLYLELGIISKLYLNIQDLGSENFIVNTLLSELSAILLVRTRQFTIVEAKSSSFLMDFIQLNFFSGVRLNEYRDIHSDFIAIVMRSIIRFIEVFCNKIVGIFQNIETLGTQINSLRCCFSGLQELLASGVKLLVQFPDCLKNESRMSIAYLELLDLTMQLHFRGNYTSTAFSRSVDEFMQLESNFPAEVKILSEVVALSDRHKHLVGFTCSTLIIQYISKSYIKSMKIQHMLIRILISNTNIMISELYIDDRPQNSSIICVNILIDAIRKDLYLEESLYSTLDLDKLVTGFGESVISESLSIGDYSVRQFFALSSYFNLFERLVRVNDKSNPDSCRETAITILKILNMCETLYRNGDIIFPTENLLAKLSTTILKCQLLFCNRWETTEEISIFQNSYPNSPLYLLLNKHIQDGSTMHHDSSILYTSHTSNLKICHFKSLDLHSSYSVATRNVLIPFEEKNSFSSGNLNNSSGSTLSLYSFEKVNNQSLQSLASIYSYESTQSPWIVISGSDDPLYVLISYSYDQFSSHFYGVIRAINSTGFKIPSFQIKWQCVFNHLGSSPISDILSFYSDEVIDCTKYLQPNALVDRRFSIPIETFCSLAVSIHIIYDDLDIESSDCYSEIAQSVVESFSDNETSKQTMNIPILRQGRTFTCEDLRIPCYVFLSPICGLTQFKFESLWNKFPFSFTCRIQSFENQSFSPDSVKNAGNNINNFCSCCINVGKLVASSKTSDICSTFAWAYQTKWGDLVFVMARLYYVSVEKNINALSCWKGSLEIRSQTLNVVNTISDHGLMSFVSTISAELIAVDDNMNKPEFNLNFDEKQKETYSVYLN